MAPVKARSHIAPQLIHRYCGQKKARWREPAGFGRNFDYGEFIAENFVLNKAGN